MSDLLQLADSAFCDMWGRMSQDERANLSPAIRAAAIERYRKLTPWVEQSIDRAKREEKERVEQARRDSCPVIFRQMSEIQSKPIRWLWPGRIARGKVSILAGNPGLGKSQIMASMTAIVSTAGQWPVDRTRCERGNVIILSAEDDAEDTIRPRLEAAGADLSRVFVLDAVINGYSAKGQELRRAFN